MPSTYLLQKSARGTHFIELDPATVKKMTMGGNKRVICRLNDQIDLHSALLPQKQGGYCIHIGAAVCKQLKLKAGASLTAHLVIDTSPLQFDLPEELAEVLATDPPAQTVFEGLTDGNKRGLIYLVSKFKTVDKRIEKSLQIAACIKKGITSPKQIK